jgi:hypothetical protein
VGIEPCSGRELGGDIARLMRVDNGYCIEINETVFSRSGVSRRGVDVAGTLSDHVLAAFDTNVANSLSADAALASPISCNASAPTSSAMRVRRIRIPPPVQRYREKRLFLAA